MGEQVKFTRYSPENNLSPSVQNFVPIALTKIIPTNNVIPLDQDKKALINEQAHYCGQAYDEKHAWKIF